MISVTRERDARYEWTAHVRVAREAEVPEEVIDAIRSRGDLAHLDPDDAIIITFVRELLRSNQVSDETFAALREAHDTRWVVELAAVVGHYQFVSSINNTFRIEPNPDGDQLPV